MSNLRLSRAVLGLMAVLAMPSAVLAQDLPYVPDFFTLRPQTYADVPGVPGPNGCVKWCFQDQSPCDPPLYKRADGRCSSISRH